MQIVIEIPEGTYDLIKHNVQATSAYQSAYYAIRRGTGLPKGHGALKDADKLAVAIAMIRDKYGYYGECEPELFQAYDNCVDKIVDATTIIEADKEEAEE